MAGGEPFVAEVAVDLEHPLEPPHHETLQIQLGGDPEEQWNVEGVMPGLERTRHRPARERLHHRRLDLEKPPLGEESAHEVHHPGAGAEGLARLFVHDEIEVAPAVTRLPVGESVELLGQRAERLREQPEAIHPEGELSGAGPERNPFRPDDVTDVETAEIRIRAIREVLPPHVELDAPGAVLDVGEACLPHYPAGHHPAGNPVAARRERILVQVLALAADGRRGRARAEVVRKGVARHAKGSELRAPPSDLFVLRNRRAGRGSLRRGGPARPPVPRPALAGRARPSAHAPTPALRLASMKGSRFPSSIPWVLPVSIPVRRSLIRDWSST